MTRRDDASEAQVLAADPGVSTWLTANAGSGKTRVLTDRVARLLLAGTEPDQILCLTYTKAAAGEMQNRLFDRLGAWSMSPDDTLRADLAALGLEGPHSAETLAEARRLFARAIETPGGLKIQTIHAFCAALLRRFPLEAGVSPSFRELDEQAAKRLRLEVMDQLSAGPASWSVAEFMVCFKGQDLDKCLAEIAGKAEVFREVRPPGWARKALDVPANLTRTAIHAALVDDNARGLLAELLAVMSASDKVTDQKHARWLAPVVARGVPPEDQPILERVFLTQSGANPFSAKVGAIPTRDARRALAGSEARLDAFAVAVRDAFEARVALEQAQRAEILAAFGWHFCQAYDAAKARRGVLDFDDLITKVRALLENEDVAAWVLWKLDGGIAHILVDEAQDTSPAQWKLVERLSEEFTAGDTAGPNARRTVFVVGDPKQSIYRFQGARPEAFEEMRAVFSARESRVRRTMRDRELRYSFRSSRAVLEVVDAVITLPHMSGVSAGSGHLNFFDLPGRVDLWSPVEEVGKVAEPEWADPSDVTQPPRHERILAKRIAREIKRLVDQGAPLPKVRDGEIVFEPMTCGDVLVLVQSRGQTFTEIIRACKALELPIAGADRMKLADELAVQDILALLKFLDLPEDDLSLAAALRSPLMGWTEAELYDAAAGRGGKHLWQVVREQGGSLPGVEMLGTLLKQADFLRPYELIERVLVRHRGRARLIQRLGPEAEEGIDALLDQALIYEGEGVPSLTGFLQWMLSDDFEIKRQAEAAGGRIRVMTVHGAKGLEAPVVILPQTHARDAKADGMIVPHDGGVFWRGAKADGEPPLMQALRSDATAAWREENQRLLYVAMTRAESWLIVCGAGKLGKAPGDSWYRDVEAGFAHVDAVQMRGEQGAFQRVESGNWAGTTTKLDDSIEPAPALPGYFAERAAVPAVRGILSPSKLGGAHALPGGEGVAEEIALAEGSAVHRLLEILPSVAPERRLKVGRILLSNELPGTSEAALDQALAILEDPRFEDLFGSDILTEVDISAALPELDGRPMLGTIDLLKVSETNVLAVDFKTNRLVPDRPEQVPQGLLRQMGAYLSALMQVFPERRLEVAILWTVKAELMVLPHHLVLSSLRDATPA